MAGLKYYEGMPDMFLNDNRFDSDDAFLSFADVFSYYGTPAKVKRGEYLFSVETPKEVNVSLITKGTVKASQLAMTGNEHIFNIFRRNDILFLLAAVLNQPPQLDFIATEDTELLTLPNDRFMALAENDSRVAMIVVDHLANQLASAHRRHREAESYSTEWKVCNMLLSFAERSGVEYDGKILIHDRISQQDMAGLLKVSRITIARILKNLRNYGLIETVNGYTCIRDEEKLRQHMYYVSIPLD